MPVEHWLGVGTLLTVLVVAALRRRPSPGAIRLGLERDPGHK